MTKEIEALKVALATFDARNAMALIAAANDVIAAWEQMKIEPAPPRMVLEPWDA